MLRFLKLLPTLIVLFALAACQPNSLDQSLASNNTSKKKYYDYSSLNVFLLRGSAAKYERILQATQPEFVIIAVDELRTKQRNSMSPREIKHTVVFVIDKKYPAGSSIVTTHEYETNRGGPRRRLGRIPFKYVVSSAQSKHPLIILNESQAGGGINIYYSMFVNGRLVKEVRIPIG